MKKKILVIAAAGALGALLTLPATARAVAAWAGSSAAHSVAPTTPAALALMANLQGAGAATRGAIDHGGTSSELIAWAKLQDHLKRVETVWGTTYHEGPGGEVVPDPEAPPKYIIVRAFDSPYDYAPLVVPPLGHAALRFTDDWGSSWFLPLVPLGQNFFWAEIHATATLPWATLGVEALAWRLGDDSMSSSSAYYRSPLVGL